MNVIGFYHEYEENGCFSNWYKSDFTVNSITYWCAEQYMMHRKALLFNAEKTAERIMSETDQRTIKQLGQREIPGYVDHIWDSECQKIMRIGLYNKFTQNDELKRMLLATRDSILAECSVNDHKWGIGLDISDGRINQPHKWCGRNLLGYILMKVRDDIRNNNEPDISIARPKITIMKADITKLDVDVIVNAANKSLLGGGGVDGAIHYAAGPDLLKECKTLGGAETGEVKITNGYNLPAKRIIHTPGPVWRGGNQKEEGKLANCWRRSLCLAMEEGLHSIAFPSISTGVYGYPLDLAAKVAVKTTVEFLYNNPNYDMDVIVAAFDDRTKHAYQIALGEALTPFITKKTLPLDNDIISKLNPDDVFAVHMSAGGAEGTPGIVNVYCSSDSVTTIYEGNYVYGDLDLDALIKRLVIDGLDLGIFLGDSECVPTGWGAVYLGGGHNLLLRTEIYDILKYRYKDMEPSDIYCVFAEQIIGMNYSIR